MTLDNDQPVIESASGRTEPARRWSIWLALIAVAFLIGFLPMWLSSRALKDELRSTQRELRRTQIQNTLGTAVVDARRGEYEAARQAASRFFTDVGSELAGSSHSVLADQERAEVGPALSERDDIITLLSRSDPAGAEKLSNLDVRYRNATSAP